MKDKNLEIFALYDFAWCDVNIMCSSCKKQLKYGSNPSDVSDSIETFYDEGWRATNKNCYCPECAKIKLKT